MNKGNIHSVLGAIPINLVMENHGTHKQVKNVVVRNERISDTVDEPMRAVILDILADEPRTVTEIHECLEEQGIDRTENTVRYHLKELYDASLVDTVQSEGGNSGATTYYSANTVVLSHSLPDSAEPQIAELVDAVHPQITDAIITLTTEYEEEIEDLAMRMQSRDRGQSQTYESFILLMVLRRAYVRSYRESRA